MSEREELELEQEIRKSLFYDPLDDAISVKIISVFILAREAGLRKELSQGAHFRRSEMQQEELARLRSALESARGCRYIVQCQECPKRIDTALQGGSDGNTY